MKSMTGMLGLGLVTSLALSGSGCASKPAVQSESVESGVRAPASVIDLSSDGSELARAFNASSDIVQLVMFLSPT